MVNPKKINTSIITKYYDSDFDGTKLNLHRNVMLDVDKVKKFKISVSDAIEFLKKEAFTRFGSRSG
jgi:hypothetical protein